MMLDRRIDQFRAIAEAAEGFCRDAGVEVHPGIVDALTRRWIGLVARVWSESGQPDLLGMPEDLGRLIADEMIDSERELRAQRAAVTLGAHP